MADAFPIDTLEPVPPRERWPDIRVEEWAEYVTGTLAATDGLLSLGPDEFEAQLPGLEPLLRSYVGAYSDGLLAHEGHGDGAADAFPPRTPDELGLRENVFLLLHRAVAEARPAKVPGYMLEVDFLGRVVVCFAGVPALEGLLAAVWSRAGDEVETELRDTLAMLQIVLEQDAPASVEDQLGLVAGLVRLDERASQVAMTATDFLDGLIRVYPELGPRGQEFAALLLEGGLLSLGRVEKGQYSLLADQLYMLKSRSRLEDAEARAGSLLIHTISYTFLLDKLDLSDPKASRARRLVDELRAYKLDEARPAEGQGRQPPVDTAASWSAVPAEVMTKIDGIREMFPDLGAGFVRRLLESYGDDSEQALMALLDGNLPPHIDSLDRGLELDVPKPVPKPTATARPAAVDATIGSRLDIKNRTLPKAVKPVSTASILASSAGAKESVKTSVLASLARFDANEDERDDSYDGGYLGDPTRPRGGGAGAGRVGVEDEDEDEDGLVDEGRPGAELAAFEGWRAGPSVFLRTRAARTSGERARLRGLTGWTDDRLEEWAILLARDPARQRYLEGRARDPLRGRRGWDGGESDGSDGGEVSDGGDDGGASGPRRDRQGPARGGSHGGGSGRGRGRGRGRGGNVAGGSGDRGTRQARGHKEANKAVRGNHGRRGQYLRKMGGPSEE